MEHKNNSLASRYLRKVLVFLNAGGTDANDLKLDDKCFNLTGIDSKGLRNHFENGFVADKHTWENMNHKWHIGFHTNPNRLNLDHKIQRGHGFCYENMFVKPVL